MIKKWHLSLYSLLISFPTLVLSAENTSKNEPAERPNIVWLIAEDLSPDFGCYGNSLVKTPNINKLSERGIIFENAFASCPVCSPSRSAFITGMYQTSIGADYHDTMEKNKLSLPDGVATLPDILQDRKIRKMKQCLNYGEKG